MQSWSRLTAGFPHFASAMHRLQSSWDARPARAWWWRAAARYAWQQLWPKTSDGRPNTARCVPYHAAVVLLDQPSTLVLASYCTYLQFKAALLCSGCVSPEHSIVDHV